MFIKGRMLLVFMLVLSLGIGQVVLANESMVKEEKESQVTDSLLVDNLNVPMPQGQEAIVEQNATSDSTGLTPAIEFDSASNKDHKTKNKSNYYQGTEPISMAKFVVYSFLVLGLIFLLAYFLKKYKLVPGAFNGRLGIVTSLAVGSKEKLVLVRVGDEELLIGVTPQNVNLVYKLPMVSNNDEARTKNEQSFCSKQQEESDFLQKLKEARTSLQPDKAKTHP